MNVAAGQSVENPNYGLKSPLTAELVRVDFNTDATVVWLTIMSDINNAWFCIDRNTFLVRPDGVKLKLTGLKGLPHCPATYKFKRPGEKTSFSLIFRKIRRSKSMKFLSKIGTTPRLTSGAFFTVTHQKTSMMTNRPG